MAEIKLRCPTGGDNPLKGCGSENVFRSEEEPDLVDCCECGIWFPLAEGIGLVGVELTMVDGTTTLVFVKANSPLVDGSWSAHRAPESK